MESIMLIGVLVGLIQTALAVPLILEKIPRNGIYGFRVAKTLSEDRIWYPANKRCGLGLLLAGVITTSGSILLNFFFKANFTETSLVVLIIIPIFFILFDSFRYLKKLG